MGIQGGRRSQIRPTRSNRPSCSVRSRERCALPTDRMFIGDTRDLRVGFTRQDDYDLDEMIGADTRYFDELDPYSLKEFGQDDLAPVRRRSHAHHLKTTFTGMVRGSIRSTELHHVGPWVRMTFNKRTKQRWGIHEVLALIFQDNKQRFLVAGSEDDPRAEYYPLWVRAAHGHSVNLDLDDRDIAVRWFTLVPRDQGPLAPYKGRPCAVIEDVPPRLYHRTVEDAAFQILDGELTPGFGDSGKLHNYFSSLPLEEMTNQACVRKDLPIEIVFETSAVLRYAYLFETASDGVLCREKVPGSTILYIRNSAKDEILYSRPTETPASEAAALMDDTSPTQVVAVTQSASASTDLAIIPEEPRPRTATTHLEFPCPKCQNSCRVGQFYCGKCTEPLRDLARSNVRRTVQMARLRAVNEICARSGMAPSSISVEHIRGSQGSDISQRGLLSLGAESTQTAKKQVKSALKLGFKSVLDRFINDVGIALRSTE